MARELNGETIDYMKSHHVTLVPTVYIVDNLMPNGEKMHMPDLCFEEGQRGRREAIGQLQAWRCRTASTSLPDRISPTSQGREPGATKSISEVKFGMIPQQALVTATKHGAEFLGLDDCSAPLPSARKAIWLRWKAIRTRTFTSSRMCARWSIRGEACSPANRKDESANGVERIHLDTPRATRA